MPIETSLTRAAPGDVIDVDVFAVPMRSEGLSELLPAPVEALLAHYEAKGEAGEVVEVPVALRRQVVARADGFALGETRDLGIGRVLLYGTGDGTAGAMRKAGAAVARRAKGCAAVAVQLPGGDAEAFAEAALLASYTFKISAKEGKGPVGVIVVSGAGGTDKGVTRARAAALARDLTNTPAMTKSPAWLAEQAVAVAEAGGLESRVWTEPDLERDGFGGILAVGMGSERPPCLVQLSYDPPGATEHRVLVGKGITFDSGGLSLKPTEGMKSMKTDMAGGGAVIGVMSALAALGVTKRVTGLIACAENMPSGSAQRPSDVIRQYGGRTVEVLNTDAEGRLVLADALAYADARLNPDVIVNVATLTGAARIALGTGIGALYATDDELAAALSDAGQESGERVWRMPLVEDYVPALKSSIADLANIEQGSVYSGGSITAALFLREFVGGRRWAHLDIAGPGRATAEDAEITKGGTGFGTRLLLAWLSRS